MAILADESLRTLVATAVGGLIALFGVISTQRANVRKEYYEKKAQVYREILEMFHRQYAAAERNFHAQGLARKLEALSRHLPEKSDADSGELEPITPQDVQKVLKLIELKAEQVAAFSEDPKDVAEDGKKAYLAQAKIALYTSKMVNGQGAIVHIVAPRAYSDSPRTVSEMKRFWAEIRRLENAMRRELFWGGGNIVMRSLLLVYSIVFISKNWVRMRGLRKRNETSAIPSAVDPPFGERAGTGSATTDGP